MKPGSTLPGRGSQEGHGALEHTLGLRSNRARIVMLVIQVAFVGAMVGVERTVLPLLAKQEFGLASKTAALSFILAFGLAKAPGNLVAGRLADRFGRRKVLIAGWVFALPVPLIISVAPSWSWVIGANLLLGVQQALCWSTSIFMKVDVAGPRRRGVVIGINEFAGYAGTAAAAYATGVIAARAGIRVSPFLFGELLAIAGLISAIFLVKETSFYLRVEEGLPGKAAAAGPFVSPAIRQAGFVTKLADVAVWGLLPIYFAERGLNIETIGVLAAAYPASWALLQPAAGAISDRWGRWGPITAGMAMQALGLAVTAASDRFAGWLGGLLLLGLGTALVYPVLLAAAGDLASAESRASAIGHYRLWRDLGFVGGGLGVGVLADGLGTVGALQSLAVLALASGAFLAAGVRIRKRAP